MNLTPGTTIERGDTVTRQTIFDLVANAAGGIVQASDLSTQVLPITVNSSLTAANLTVQPGRLWYDQTDQLAKVFVDMIDSTGCSLWLAFGPDRFDVALLADEPIPFGAAVQIVGNGRHAKLPPDAISLLAQGSNFQWEVAKVIGFNVNGHASDHSTAASGAWFAAAVSGYTWMWYPVNDGTGFASVGTESDFDSIIASTSITGPTGISNVRGGMVNDSGALTTGTGRRPLLCHSMHRFNAFQGQNWARRLFFGPRMPRF